MIFKVLLYYALAKGVWKGLHKRKPMSIQDFDNILSKFYVMPIMEQLNDPNTFRFPDYSKVEEIRVEAGSML